MSPRVSVLMPVYNGAGSVARAVRSIGAQTFSDWELLICDDGSADASLQICKDLAREEPRIRLVRNTKNLGLAASMNRLVSLAASAYCAVQEQDDISVPERLEWELAVLDRRPDVGVVSGVAEWLDDEGRVFAHFPGLLQSGGQFPEDRNELVRYLYVEQSKVVNAAAMIRRSLFREAGLVFDEAARMSVDWQFFVDAAHISGIVGLHKVVVRMGRGNQRRSLTSDKALQFREGRRCIRVLYERYGKNPASPIDYGLYRKAMATELVLEARHFGPVLGLKQLVGSLVYSPTHRRAWKTARDFVARGARALTAGRRHGRTVAFGRSDKS